MIYVGIMMLVLAGPLLLSFDRRVAFHTNWKAVVKAMIPVSGIYIVWDILVTRRGDWWFNPEYAGEIKLLGLPPGEWLFFFLVPYACLFIYEVVRSYFPRRYYKPLARTTPKLIIILAGAAAVLSLIGACIFRSLDYSFLTLVFFAAWIIITLLWNPWLFRDIHTLWFLLLSSAAFLVINGILTGLPIVLYSSEAIWGVRIITIPLEDLFYNLSFLGLIQNCYVRIKGYHA